MGRPIADTGLPRIRRIQGYVRSAREVSLHGIMEAPLMDADKPMIRINPAQDAFDRTQAAYAAKRARKIAENDALNRIQPGDKLDDFPART